MLYNMHEYLTALERDLVKTFAEHEPMVAAVKKVLLHDIYESDPTKSRFVQKIRDLSDTGADDSVIGAHARAVGEGVSLLEQGFRAVERFKGADTKRETKNVAK
jgi:hypothetical protein